MATDAAAKAKPKPTVSLDIGEMLETIHQQHQQEIEELELRGHELRVLGAAQMLAWTRHHVAWDIVAKSSQEQLYNEAGAFLALLDSLGS